MTLKRVSVEILSAPDNLGRVMLDIGHYNPHPPYCLTCGKDPARKCKCYGPGAQHTVSFRVPTKEEASCAKRS